MRKIILAVFLVIGFCHPAPATGTTIFSADENSFQFLVYQRTIDGDTIKVDVNKFTKSSEKISQFV